MAILSDADRQRVTNGLMRYWSKLFEPLGSVSKSQLRAAIDATDQWVENNQASFNSALPEPARTELSTAQKTLIFCAVAVMRVSPSFARAILGEID